MKEEDSSMKLNSSEPSKFKVNRNLSKQFGSGVDFDPINQIGIQVNKSDPADQQQIEKLLGMYLTYPSTELAEIHAEAMKIGNYDLETHEEAKEKIVDKDDEGKKMMQENRKTCPCCGFVRQQESIKYCTPIDGIKNIGTSTNLYFYTFKNLSLLLAIMAVVYSIYAIVTNVLAAEATSNSLYNLDYITITLAAKQKNINDQNKLYYFVQCWLGVVTIIIWFLVLVGIKFKQIKRSIEYDNDTSSAADYSIVLEGMPLDVTRQELQTQLTAYYNNVVEYQKIPQSRRRPFNIENINIGRPFYLHQDQIESEEINTIEKELEELKEKFIFWILERVDKPSFSTPKEVRMDTYKKYEELYMKRMTLVNQQMQKLKNKLKEEKGDQLTTVFVTLQTNIAHNLMVNLNQVTIYSRLKGIFGDKNRFEFKRGDRSYSLTIGCAPEPQDIIWTNIGFQDCSKYIRKFITYLLTAALLGGSFGIVYGLSQKQNDLTVNNPNDAVSRYLSIAISLVISVVNVAIVLLVKFLTKFEKDYTTTNYQASLAIKAILAQMINSILIPVIVAYYIKQNIYESSGLVDNTFMMSFTLSLVSPIVVFFDPLNYFTMAIRCWKRQVKSKFYQTQKEHNTFHEGIEFEVGYEYIYVINLFMWVCFYVSLQPICVFVAIIGYFMMYWVQKYCMLYRYKRPVPATEFINQAVYQFIHFGPLIYSLGSFTWSNFLPDGIPDNAIIPNIVAIVISVLVFVVPIKLILLACFFNDQSTTPCSYQEERITFSTQYDRLNPTTQEEATIEYNKYCEKYAQNYKKMSAEKQAQIALKRKKNNEKGQLNNMHQQHMPSMREIGGSNTASLFAGMIQPQQSAINPYNVFNAFQHQHPAPPPQGGMIGGMMPPSSQKSIAQNIPQQNPNNAFAAMFAPQPAHNPMNSGMGGMGGMGAMGGMGGMGAMGGMMMNPMNQMYGGRMF